MPLLVLGQGRDLASERGVECPGDLPAPSDPDLVARARAAKATLGELQGTVGVDHFGNDPGAVLIGPGRCGTGFNDRPKGVVDPDFAIWVIAKVDQPFA